MVSQTMSDDRTADEIRADVLRAARDALKNYSGDATTSARYDKRKGAERAFDAAMDALRPVPVDVRPDGLVECVDQLTSLARHESRSKAEEALTDAVAECLTRSIEDEDGEWVHVEDAEDLFERGDEITVRYREHSGGADEEPGEWVKVTGTVRKNVPRGSGGLWVTIEEDTHRESWRKLHRVPGGTVTGTNPYGNRKVRKGLRAKVLLPEDTSTDEAEEVADAK